MEIQRNSWEIRGNHKKTIEIHRNSWSRGTAQVSRPTPTGTEEVSVGAGSAGGLHKSLGGQWWTPTGTAQVSVGVHQPKDCTSLSADTDWD
jgi:hypothetical protein